jgi:hypothetical protein
MQGLFIGLAVKINNLKSFHICILVDDILVPESERVLTVTQHSPHVLKF